MFYFCLVKDADGISIVGIYVLKFCTVCFNNSRNWCTLHM